MSTIDNIKIYLKAKKILQRDFLQSVSLSEGYFGPAQNFSVDKLLEIANKYPDLNLDWLITGRGDMLRPQNNQEVNGGNNITVGGNASHVTINDTSASERLFAMLEEKDRQIAHLFDLLKEKSSFN